MTHPHEDFQRGQMSHRGRGTLENVLRTRVREMALIHTIILKLKDGQTFGNNNTEGS
jgi:hypothetical protein